MEMILSIIIYICFAIALFSTLMFISNIITSMITIFDVEEAKKAASFRIICALIMSIMWPLVIILW